MHKLVRMLAAALMAVTGLAAIGAGPAAAAVPPTEAGCPGGHQAWVHIAGKVAWTQFLEVYSGGGSPSDTTQGSATYSGLRLNLDFCTSTVIYAADVVGGTDMGLDSAFQPTGAAGKHGYALRPDYVGSNYAYANPTVCDHNGSLWATLGVIASLPIPGVKYYISVGQWVATGIFGAISGTSGRCRGMGDVGIPITVLSSGSTVIRTTTVAYVESDGPGGIAPNCFNHTWTCTVKERFVFTFTNA
jgi:hypothetical protein